MQASTELRSETEKRVHERRLRDRIINELEARLHEVRQEVSLVREYHLKYDEDENRALVHEQKDLTEMLALYTKRVEAHDSGDQELD